jgi:hypothetical protein
MSHERKAAWLIHHWDKRDGAGIGQAVDEQIIDRLKRQVLDNDAPQDHEDEVINLIALLS